MRATVLAGLAALLLLAGCGSRLNPVNWFGGSDAAPRAPAGAPAAAPAPRQSRPAVDRIVALRLDPLPGGALVTAIGLPPTQGWYDAALVPAARDADGRPAAEDGTLELRFVATPPPGQRPAGAAAAREISAGLFLGDRALESVRRIRVAGARDQRLVRP